METGRVDLSAFVAPDVVYEDDAMPDHVLTAKLDRIVGTGDRLVSIHRLRAKARHTGIDFDEPIAYLWTFREARVVHLRGFRDPDRALADLGLKG